MHVVYGCCGNHKDLRTLCKLVKLLKEMYAEMYAYTPSLRGNNNKDKWGREGGGLGWWGRVAGKGRKLLEQQ